MSELKNLNFSVILDDTDFNNKAKAIKETAKELNASLSGVLSVMSKVASSSGYDAAAAKSQRAAIKTGEIARRETDKTEEHRRRETAKTEEMERREVIKTSGIRSREDKKTAASSKREDIRTKGVNKREDLKTERERVRLAEQLRKAAERENRALKRQSGLLGELKSLAGAYLGIRGAAEFIGSMVRITGEFEKQRTALRAITQDVAGADALFERIKSLAVESPFSVSDLTAYAKQLSAFSVPLDSLYGTTKMLADVSAGLGVDMGRIILAYGQIRSASFLRGTEVRQLTEAGVPILERLAEKFTELEGRIVTVGEVFDKISRREVSFAMVDEVFRDMTSSGGMFFEMQSVLADTLAGKVSNLRDAYEIMMDEIGQKNSGVLHGSVELLTSLMRAWEDVAAVLAVAAGGFAILRVQMALSGVAASAAKLGVSKLRVAIAKLTKALLGANIAKTLTNPMSLAIVALTAATAATVAFVKAQQRRKEAERAAQDATANINIETMKEINMLDFLYWRVRDAKEGTEEYDKAKKEFLGRYGKYLSALDKEAVAAGNLADVYTRLQASVDASVTARIASSEMTKIEQNYEEQVGNVLDKFSKFLRHNKVEAGSRGYLGLLSYVLGNATLESMGTEAKNIYYADWSEELQAGAFANNIEKFRKQILEAKESFDGAKKAVDSIITEADSALAKLSSEGGNAKFEPKEWMLIAWDFIEKFDTEGKILRDNLKPGENDGWFDWIAKVREVYADNAKKLANAYEKDKPEYERYLRLLEDFGKVVGFNLTEQTAPIRDTSATTKSAGKPQEQVAIEERIDLLKRLADAYSEFKSRGLSDEEINKTMANIFGEEFETGDYSEKLREAVDALEQYDKAAAERERQSMKDDAVKAELERIDAEIEKTKELEQIQKDYYASMKEWQESVSGLAGTGVQFDINKILDELKKADIEINEKVAEQMNMLAQMDKSDEERRKETEAINALAEAERASARARANDSLMGMANSVYGEMTSGLDMTDWSDKTLRQVRSIRETLTQIMNLGDFDKDIISPELAERAKKAGIEIDDLLVKVKELAGADLRNVSEEQKKKIIEGINTAASAASDTLSGMAESFGELAEYDPKMESLSETMQGMSEVVSFASGILSSLAQGNWIGAIISAVASLAQGIAEAFVAERLYLEELERAISSYNMALTLQSLEFDAADFETSFGEKSISALRDAWQKATDALAEYNEYVNKAYTPDYKDGSSVFQFGGLGTSFGEAMAWNAAELEKVEQGLTELQGMAIKTKDKNWIQEFFGATDKYESLLEYSERLGHSLWDENGAFSVENARAFLEAETALEEEQKEMIQDAIDLYEAYEEAEQAAKDYLSEVLGSLASDLTDALFTAVEDGSSAWDSWAETGGEAIKSLGKMLTEELLVSEFMEAYGDTLFDAMRAGDTTLFANTLSEMFAGLKEALPVLQEGVQDLYDLAESQGFIMDSDGSDSLANSISSSMTEETANLLASYINAIRSMVSQLLGNSNAFMADIAGMSSLLGENGGVSLSEYMNRVLAYQANIAASTAETLAVLRSTLSSRTGQKAFRVEVN